MGGVLFKVKSIVAFVYSTRSKKRWLSLADCFVCKDEQLLRFDMHFVTGAEELHGTSVEIIEYPKLIFQILNLLKSASALNL
jgi:hypothetical protein